MEVQTPPGLCEEIQRQAERTSRQENAGDSRRQDRENSNGRDRRTFKNRAQNYHLEAVERAEETPMGISEAGNRKRPCKVMPKNAAGGGI